MFSLNRITDKVLGKKDNDNPRLEKMRARFSKDVLEYKPFGTMPKGFEQEDCHHSGRHTFSTHGTLPKQSHIDEELTRDQAKKNRWRSEYKGYYETSKLEDEIASRHAGKKYKTRGSLPKGFEWEDCHLSEGYIFSTHGTMPKGFEYKPNKISPAKHENDDLDMMQVQGDGMLPKGHDKEKYNRIKENLKPDNTNQFGIDRVMHAGTMPKGFKHKPEKTSPAKHENDETPSISREERIMRANCYIGCIDNPLNRINVYKKMMIKKGYKISLCTPQRLREDSVYKCFKKDKIKFFYAVNDISLDDLHTLKSEMKTQLDSLEYTEGDMDYEPDEALRKLYKNAKGVILGNNWENLKLHKMYADAVNIKIISDSEFLNLVLDEMKTEIKKLFENKL